MLLGRCTILFALLALGCSSAPGDGDRADLLDVVDGDTIRVSLTGATEDVRLVGVNTPEMGECWALEAESALRTLLGSNPLRLSPGGGDERDRFGRMLAYVHVGDTLVNLDLVRSGHGVAMATEHTRAAEFDAAGEAAWSERAGMWGPSACGGELRGSLVIDGVNPDPAGDDSDRPNDETVVLRNAGGLTLDLSGWIIRDESSSHRLVLPPTTQLAGGKTLTVRSGCGADSAGEVHWCQGPVWSNAGDTVIVQTPDGTVVDRVSYRS